MKKTKILAAIIVVISLVADIIPLSFCSQNVIAAVDDFNDESGGKEVMSKVQSKANKKNSDVSGKFKNFQGGCCDGKFAYVTLQYTVDGNKGVYKNALLKIKMSNWSIKEIKMGLDLDHCNDMAYNNNTKEIVVCHNKGDLSRVTIIDAETLNVKETKKLNYPLYAIGYNKAHDRYIIGFCRMEGGTGREIAIVKPDTFEVESKFDYEDKGFVKQGIDCDNEYIYLVQSGNGSSTNGNILLVYDWAGNPITNITIDRNQEYESEFICHKGKTFFIGFTHKKDGKYNQIIYSYDLRRNQYRVKYDPNGGTGEMPDTVMTCYNNIPLSHNTYVKEGFKFTGWFLFRKSDSFWKFMNGDGSQKAWHEEGKQPEGFNKQLYWDDSKVKNLSKRDGDEITAYAQWEMIKYKAEYDANGATGDQIPPAEVNFDTVFAATDCSYVYDHQTFLGWNLFRTSDSKWMYIDASATQSGWYADNEVPEGFVRWNINPGMQLTGLTGCDGDVIRLVAAWQPDQQVNYVEPSTLPESTDSSGNDINPVDMMVTHASEPGVKFLYKNYQTGAYAWFEDGCVAAGYVKQEYSTNAFMPKTYQMDANVKTVTANSCK